LREALCGPWEGGGDAVWGDEGPEDRAEGGEVHCGCVVWQLVVVTVGECGVGDFEMEYEDPGRRQDHVSVSEVRRR
jgi:hypothetical protein